MFVKQIQIESLGNSSYLVGSEDAKVCAVIDPVRDVDLYVREAADRGHKILYALETHVHNDFVSGSRELAAQIGATVCASAAGGLVYEHRPLRPGDSIELGEVRLDVIATPGHTPEHVSYLATDTGQGDGPHALFSGGALLVGGVARTDLMGADVAPFLGRWFHRTIERELRGLDDSVEVYPTHGAGSFCLVTPAGSGASTTTIGDERRVNPFFQATSEDEFLDLAGGDLPTYPAYYSRMAELNVRGPRIMGSLPAVFPLGAREVWVRLQRASVAVDNRSPADYARAHIPRSYSIPFSGSAGTWVGWLLPEGAPVVLVADTGPDREEMVRQLVRIGYDNLDGYLDGGMEAWTEARLPVNILETTTPAELYEQMETGGRPSLVDVRFSAEWDGGHVPGAVHVELGDLQGRAGSFAADGSYAMFCAAGVRASTAASVMRRNGIEDVSVVVGGTNAWEAARLPMER